MTCFLLCQQNSQCCWPSFVNGFSLPATPRAKKEVHVHVVYICIYIGIYIYIYIYIGRERDKTKLTTYFIYTCFCVFSCMYICVYLCRLHLCGVGGI